MSEKIKRFVRRIKFRIINSDKPKHPAKFSDEILDVIEPLINGLTDVVDVFGGTGKLRTICPTATIVELESEWAPKGAFIGDATDLPTEWSGRFEACVTSPCYGNRMADTYVDGSDRITYTARLGRKLSANNAGSMQWGAKYRELHEKAWREVHRILKPSGLFVLNVSDHIRKGKRVYVSQWHLSTVKSLGFLLIDVKAVKTRRMRRGQNYDKRVDEEYIYVFRKRE